MSQYLCHLIQYPNLTCIHFFQKEKWPGINSCSLQPLLFCFMACNFHPQHCREAWEKGLLQYLMQKAALNFFGEYFLGDQGCTIALVPHPSVKLSDHMGEVGTMLRCLVRSAQHVTQQAKCSPPVVSWIHWGFLFFYMGSQGIKEEDNSLLCYPNAVLLSHIQYVIRSPFSLPIS